MRFLAPLGFLFAAALPVIVFFYLLKLRRVRREVSSTLLWRRAAEDVQANAPFQKLRRNLLLLLQLLIAALLVFGLARPYFNLQAGSARHTVILLDHSASMGATDGGGGRSRLDAAREAALRFVRDMGPGDQAMLVPFADKASVACQFTADKGRLEQAIRAVSATDLPTFPADAFSLAQSLARPVNAQLLVISDGCFDAKSIQVARGVRCSYISVGTGRRNAGIVALDLRRPPENNRQFEVFATVRNFAAAPMEGRLEVLGDGRVVDVRPVRIAPGAEASQVFSSAQLAEGRVELRLTPPDDFAADNTAYAVIAPPRQRRMALVGTGNYFLDRVLRQDRAHSFEIVRVPPSQYAPSLRADVFIFDGFAPPAPLPAGSYLFINAVPPVDGFTETGREEAPPIFDWDAQHPVMRYVELGDVQIRTARRIALPGASQVLAESRETPLIAVYAAGNRSIVLWAFDLFDSSLPLRVAFPILVSNSLDWLMRGAAATESSTLPTGQVIQVDPPADFRKGRMTDPGGQAWVLNTGAAGRILFDRTGRAGFYRAEFEGAAATAREFGVSLVNAAESDIAPRAALNLPGGEVKSAAAGARANREVWRWFVLAALAIVLIEWLVYHRRVWV